jgi:polyphosphate kinase
MRARFLELVQREIENKRKGKPARIIAKLNQLEDPEMIKALCEASAAGVSIDLIIRGFCCLRPGVPGRTENIRVRSIIGRFLEHSRIYYFANGSDDPLKGDIYIGSADWMYRNLSKRVEVVTPILSDGPKEKLWEILSVYLNDTRNSWTLANDGVYSRLIPAHDADENSRIGTYEALMKMTRRRSDA